MKSMNIMMNRPLPDSAIEYIFYHLNQLSNIRDLEKYIFTDKNETSVTGIYFPLSAKSLDYNEIISIDSIPVLFPRSESKQWYTTEGKSIVFHHDILKSAFYLLSGYQEYGDVDYDEFGRYKYHESIQYLLGITDKPIVNYYFEIILYAIDRFCQLNNIPFQRNIRTQPVLFLSHDVDRVKKYSVRNFAYVLLQLLKIKPSQEKFARRLKNVCDYAIGTLSNQKDPYWNFNEILEFEKQLNITSTWYFLDNTGDNNSTYSFESEKIGDLIRSISDKDGEIGIHGTFEGSESFQSLYESISRLNKVCLKPVSGIRQHYLKYIFPTTTYIQVKSQLEYDSTLGFAERIGFRNSYAYPFKLFDFDNNKVMDIWQIPLNVMDVTLLDYMKLPIDTFMNSIKPILDEVIKFNGVFSLLWHNCRLDEKEYQGINNEYQKILREINHSGLIPMKGEDVIREFS